MTSAIIWIALLSAAEARVNRAVEDDLSSARLEVLGEASPFDPDSVDDPELDGAAELQASLFGDWTMAKV